jgi:hypothetical protein
MHIQNFLQLGKFNSLTWWLLRLRRSGRPVGPSLNFGTMALVSLAIIVLSLAAQAAPAYRGRLLTQGLANPRGLLVDGPRLLVSEAGSGPQPGSSGSPCITPRQHVVLCEGATGAIGAWDRLTGSYSRLITGLPSLAQSNGSEGTGIADLAWHDSSLMGVFGLGANPGMPAVSQLSPLFGQVVQIDLTSQVLTPRSNLAAYEKMNNPDGDADDVNSNPYAIASFAGKLFATDAGGNTLLTIDPSASDPSGLFPITNNYVFPKVDVTLGPPFIPAPEPDKASAVPTGLTVDHLNRKLKIAELTGFPFEAGAASTFSLSTNATVPSQDATGFSMISDVAAGPDGSLYILEYANNFFQPVGGGSVWLIDPAGVRSQIITGLTQPTGLAVDPYGVLYVSNNADGIQGELLQFTPVPGPLPLLGAWAAWSHSRRLRRRLRPCWRGRKP